MVRRRRRRRRVQSCGIIDDTENVTVNGGTFVQAGRDASVTEVTNNTNNTNVASVVLVQININIILDGQTLGRVVLVCLILARAMGLQ